MDTCESDDLQPTSEALGKIIIAEVASVFHFRKNGILHKLLGWIGKKPAKRFACLLKRLDKIVAEEGFNPAAKVGIAFFTDGCKVVGSSLIPAEGPLLVVANHPGGADSVVAAACVSRPDVHLIAVRHPMLEAMPSISQHLIYLDAEVHAGGGIIRRVLHLLRSGQAVIIFPRGSLEPDPAQIPGSVESLAGWSDSIGFFLSRVPETCFLPLLISKVIVPKAWNHPLARLCKSTKKRQQTAIILQFAMQMLTKKAAWKTPVQVNFGSPMSASELSYNPDPRIVSQAVRNSMLQLLESAYADQP